MSQRPPLAPLQPLSDSPPNHVGLWRVTWAEVVCLTLRDLRADCRPWNAGSQETNFSLARSFHFLKWSTISQPFPFSEFSCKIILPCHSINVTEYVHFNFEGYGTAQGFILFVLSFANSIIYFNHPFRNDEKRKKVKKFSRH